MRALIEDVNNKPGQHEAKNKCWSDLGVHVVRNKLPYGDYILAPPIVVDTKRDLYELCYDLTSDHKRFSKAASLAHECDSVLVILTENDEGVSDLFDFAEWIESEKHFERRVKESKGRVKMRYKGSTLYKTCKTMQESHGMRFEFCAPQDAGARVLSILEGWRNEV